MFQGSKNRFRALMTLLDDVLVVQDQQVGAALIGLQGAIGHQ